MHMAAAMPSALVSWWCWVVTICHHVPLLTTLKMIHMPLYACRIEVILSIVPPSIIPSLKLNLLNKSRGCNDCTLIILSESLIPCKYPIQLKSSSLFLVHDKSLWRASINTANARGRPSVCLLPLDLSFSEGEGNGLLLI